MEQKIKYVYSLGDLMKALAVPTGSIGYFENKDGTRKTEFDFVVETPYILKTLQYTDREVYCVDCGTSIITSYPTVGSMRCCECDKGYRGIA